MLNLLPQNQRQITERTLLLLSLQRVSAVLLITALTLASILLVGRLILQRQFETIIAESTYLAGTKNTLTKEIKDANRTLVRLQEIQATFVRTDGLLADLADRVPTEMTLERIHVEPRTRILTLEGKSKTRTALLQFVEALETSRYLTDVKNPLQNILAEKNLGFTLTATIREGALDLMNSNQ